MKKLFISIAAVVLAVTVFFGGAVYGGNPYAIPGAAKLPGAAPFGALVLDSQNELINRTEQAYTPESGSPIDLSGYELVFEEEFEGDSLDGSRWFHVFPDGTLGRAGIKSSQYTRLEDGKLCIPIILADHEVNGTIRQTWISDDIQLRQNYSYGYYEIKAIMPRAHDGTGAFWLWSPMAYTDGVAPDGGVEIDIIESQNYGGNTSGKYGNDPQTYEVNIHYNSDENRQRLHAHGIKVPGADMYNEFHTYGLLWTPKWYVFYVDGLPAYKTTFGIAGTQAEEFVRLSTSLRGANFQKSSVAYVDNDDTDFIVDYVRIWQLDDPSGYPDFESGAFMNFLNNFITGIFTFFDRVADFFRALFKIQ